VALENPSDPVDMESSGKSPLRRTARALGVPNTTPDGRYFIVRGRLWPMADPGLADSVRGRLVKVLMGARRAVAAAKRSGDAGMEAAARREVDRAKQSLGEHGPVWWTDGAPDLNRHMVRTTGYADWYADLVSEEE
jgi:hypothetical protein